MIRVRYFAAARAAAGRDEEQLNLSEGATLEQLLREVQLRHPAAADGRTSLTSIIGRSSFLHNEVAVRDHTQKLSTGDTIDVLPPFAGG